MQPPPLPPWSAHSMPTHLYTRLVYSFSFFFYFKWHPSFFQKHILWPFVYCAFLNIFCMIYDVLFFFIEHRRFCIVNLCIYYFITGSQNCEILLEMRGAKGSQFPFLVDKKKTLPKTLQQWPENYDYLLQKQVVLDWLSVGCLLGC